MGALLRILSASVPPWQHEVLPEFDPASEAPVAALVGTVRDRRRRDRRARAAPTTPQVGGAADRLAAARRARRRVDGRARRHGCGRAARRRPRRTRHRNPAVHASAGRHPRAGGGRHARCGARIDARIRERSTVAVDERRRARARHRRSCARPAHLAADERGRHRRGTRRHSLQRSRWVRSSRSSRGSRHPTCVSRHRGTSSWMWVATGGALLLAAGAVRAHSAIAADRIAFVVPALLATVERARRRPARRARGGVALGARHPARRRGPRVDARVQPARDEIRVRRGDTARPRRTPSARSSRSCSATTSPASESPPQPCWPRHWRTSSPPEHGARRRSRG